VNITEKYLQLCKTGNVDYINNLSLNGQDAKSNKIKVKTNA
jgi:hypothetical protein